MSDGSYSLDGEVKLFDIRSPVAAQEWDMYPHGLSAFDVHELTGVFAASVIYHMQSVLCTDISVESRAGHLR